MLDTFYTMRRKRWQRLEVLLRAAAGSGARLSAGELDELGRLYRQTTSDLAIARRDFPRDRLTRYLEELVGRAHPAIYRRRARTVAGIGRFFTHGFPQAFREAG